MLKGKRVVLRPLKESDVSYFTKWFNDLDVILNLNHYLPMSELVEREWIRDLLTKRRESDIVFMIEILRKGKNIPIGSCGLHKINWKDRNAEFGIAIGEKRYWSNGYGTEAGELILDYAFNHLNLHRVHSLAYAFNEKSIGLHLKLGFEQEGIKREAAYKRGSYHDIAVFGLLRKDWKKKR